MKSAYERAMERFGSEPTVKLSDEQKKSLAELDSIYAAKIAERELTIKSETAKAMANMILWLCSSWRNRWSATEKC